MKPLALLVAFFVSACTRTTLLHAPITPEVFRLAASNSTPLILQVNEPQAPERPVGHQYLLFAIPFGSIEINEPREYVQRVAYEQLSLAGFRPLLEQTGGPQSARLTINIEHLQVSAYDLLLVRRLLGKIQLSAEVFLPNHAGPKRFTVEKRESSYERFGFRPQLTKILDSSLRQAMEAVIAEMSRI